MECQIKTQFCTYCNGVKMSIGDKCGSCLNPIQQEKDTSNNDERCNQCHSFNVYIHEQEYSTVCEDCGHVKNNNIKDTAEWTNYSGDSNRIVMSRCSMSTSLNLASSLGSYISNSKYGNFTVQGKYKDDKGEFITFEKTISLSKLNIRQSKTNEENRYDRVIEYLNKFDWGRDIIGKSLLYWKVIKNSQYKGRVRKAILALCVHYALCTIPGANHTYSYVCEKMDITLKEFTKAKQIFPRYRLTSQNPLSKQSLNSSSLINTISYHIVGKLKLPYKDYVPKCLEVHKLNKTKLQKKRFRPNTILFGVMYTVIKDKDKVVPKRRIIQYLERYCSVYTMNNVYEEINN